MSAFEIYIGKIRDVLKDHFNGNENPPIVEQMLSGEEVKTLYIKGYHPRRTAEHILCKAQEQAVQHRKVRLQRYQDEKYRLALRDNPDLTKEQWAKDFVESFFITPTGERIGRC
jgi:hypothetical protein